MPLHSQIVVIEDDENIREMLQLIMENEGYEVQTASNGEEAFQLLKLLATPCLILTDLTMPFMDGYTFIELASRTHTVATIPIVVCSAAPDISRIKVISESGKIKGLIRKPIDIDYMMRIVHQYCSPPPKPCAVTFK